MADNQEKLTFRVQFEETDIRKKVKCPRASLIETLAKVFILAEGSFRLQERDDVDGIFYDADDLEMVDEVSVLRVITLKANFESTHNGTLEAAAVVAMDTDTQGVEEVEGVEGVEYGVRSKE